MDAQLKVLSIFCHTMLYTDYKSLLNLCSEWRTHFLIIHGNIRCLWLFTLSVNNGKTRYSTIIDKKHINKRAIPSLHATTEHPCYTKTIDLKLKRLPWQSGYWWKHKKGTELLMLYHLMDLWVRSLWVDNTLPSVCHDTSQEWASCGGGGGS